VLLLDVCLVNSSCPTELVVSMGIVLTLVLPVDEPQVSLLDQYRRAARTFDTYYFSILTTTVHFQILIILGP
jgi:hypothetical protein